MYTEVFVIFVYSFLRECNADVPIFQNKVKSFSLLSKNFSLVVMYGKEAIYKPLKHKSNERISRKAQRSLGCICGKR